MKPTILLPFVLLTITWNATSCQTMKDLGQKAGTILTTPNGGSTNTGGTTTGGTTTGTTGTTGATGSTGTSGGTGTIGGKKGGGTTSTTTSGTGSTNSGTDFTKGEATDAIKQALTNGITKGVDLVSVTDGFFGNALIKIPFPENAKKVENALRQAGMGSMIDKVVLTINRAAESAAKQATPIFINAIKKMTVTDAINIVNNKQTDAATQFLQRTTTEQLVTAFKPSIKTALDQVSATKYWSDVMTQYNRIPFVSKVETDLPDYVTRKAINGLFVMVAQEEAKIRKDPMGQASNVIQKVFGNVKLK